MKWLLRNGGATCLKNVTVHYSESQCTQQQYWHEHRRCSWLHAGLYCIAPRPFTHFVFYCKPPWWKSTFGGRQSQWKIAFNWIHRKITFDERHRRMKDQTSTNNSKNPPLYLQFCSCKGLDLDTEELIHVDHIINNLDGLMTLDKSVLLFWPVYTKLS